MKKIIFLLALMLMMSSIVGFAEQPQEVSFNSEKEELTNTFNTINTSYEKKWVTNHVRRYVGLDEAPKFIQYSDQDGYTGTLNLYLELKYSDGIIDAWYEGWVYKGVQPWSLTNH